MAIARKCDLCGKYHEHYGKRYTEKDANRIAFIFSDLIGLNKCSINGYDLCPECMSSILTHIDSLKTKKPIDRIDDSREDDLK